MLDTLSDALNSRRVLLVLDNCEHVVAAAAQAAEALLQSCPELRVLATSREALNIAGETIYHVHPLGIPEPRAESTPDELAHIAAVQLFVERATSVSPAFAITPKERSSRGTDLPRT